MTTSIASATLAALLLGTGATATAPLPTGKAPLPTTKVSPQIKKQIEPKFAPLLDKNADQGRQGHEDRSHLERTSIPPPTCSPPSRARCA